ncbi:aminotransferase class I/II-fold pyridoxal phosphate-dependent enzyme [Flavobacterium sp. 25HG05S-40]|uniref:aminotransferase class I/II-fold pyridoxal phosphate-dependent enzyme n=1 Tax=Flavobacterium sp. 25HG05S-40 TaxID=3458682 RepID=UPI0040446EBE
MNIKIAAKYLDLESLVDEEKIKIIESNSGNHSITCILQTLKQNHKSIITEPFTYSAFKTIALKEGYTLHASEFDDCGLTLNGLEKTFAKTKSKVIYLQPTIHNPTCVVMPYERRKSIADFAQKNDILIIEDDAYRFLHPNPPKRFLDILPENTIHIFSLSKPFNSFLKMSYIIAPSDYELDIKECIRLTSSGNSSILKDAAAHVMENSFLSEIILEKQMTCIALKKEVLPFFEELNFQTFSTSFHFWVKLPEGIISDKLIAELEKENIVVANGKDFYVGDTNEGEKYIRVALGTEKKIENIKIALLKLSEIILCNKNFRN